MKTYNLFISHSWSYSDSYERLVELLRRRKYFVFRDYSVPRGDPIHNAGTDAQLLNAIRSKMAPCSAVLILAGVYATYSKWIDKEIKLAARGFDIQKPIIAIKPGEAIEPPFGLNKLPTRLLDGIQTASFAP